MQTLTPEQDQAIKAWRRTFTRQAAISYAVMLATVLPAAYLVNYFGIEEVAVSAVLLLLGGPLFIWAMWTFVGRPMVEAQLRRKANLRVASGDSEPKSQ